MMVSLLSVRNVPFTLLTTLVATVSYATTDTVSGNPKQIFREQQIQQQERERALEQQLAPSVLDMHGQLLETSLGRHPFPQEKPCFGIRQVILEGRDQLPQWLPLQRLADQAVEHCLGVQGIQQLMQMLNDRLRLHGYITTEVMLPRQNLTGGILRLRIQAGKVNRITLTSGNSRAIQLYSVLPVREGALLDLRDIEQGMENLRRLSTVTADINIGASTEPGASDIQIDWKQDKMWHISAYTDNSGNKSTGRYQGGAALYLENPFSLSDLLYISSSRDLQFVDSKGTRNYIAYYSVPFGYWSFSTTASKYWYEQTIAGYRADIFYKGKSSNLISQLSRVVHRNDNQKTTLNYTVQMRESRNYINDVELPDQLRRTTAWIAGIDHRHYIGQNTLDLSLSYQRGTRWFGARRAPEEYAGYGTALASILRYYASFNLPFALMKQQLRYNIQYQRQMSHTLLTPQDQFAIGNRWTVRGFDGEHILTGDNGWMVRNELSWTVPAVSSQELYMGFDYGQVSGAVQDGRMGSHLAGSVIGWRGAVRGGVSYDFSAGTPLSKPGNFTTDNVTLGFSIGWQY